MELDDCWLEIGNAEGICDGKTIGCWLADAVDAVDADEVDEVDVIELGIGETMLGISIGSCPIFEPD